MKSTKELLSFISYCIAHPEERFWQALRNWSEYHFILAADSRDRKGIDDTPYDRIRDTFSYERRRHDRE